MRNTIKMKNTLQRINSRLDDRKQWISELKDQVEKITQVKHKQKAKEKRKDIPIWMQSSKE